MLPDLGCYEERYRLTGSAALGLAAGLLAIGLGLLWHTQVIVGVITVLVAALAAALGGGVFSAARRAVAFRADHTGITLGAVPGRLPPRRGSAVFVPWTDIEQIVLYPAYPRGRGGYAQARCVGIQRRAGAPVLSQGTEQAPGCPVPGVAAGATREITGWRLDRERLAAVAAAVAPGVPIIDVSTGTSPSIEGPAQPGPYLPDRGQIRDAELLGAGSKRIRSGSYVLWPGSGWPDLSRLPYRCLYQGRQKGSPDATPPRGPPPHPQGA